VGAIRALEAIDAASVFRWVKLDEHYSNVSPKPHAGHREHKIPNEDLEKLRSLVLEKPDRTVKELAAEWNAQGVRITK
jgi:hypothetical protein